MNNSNSLKLRFMAIRFAMWDLHLYLDTHPNDTAAKQLLNKYEEQYAEIAEAYVEKYGPFEPGAAGSGEAWLKAPWPWTNCGGNA